MGLMKKLTSAVVASSLILGLVGTAFAAPAEQNQTAFDVLSTYKIVQGKLLADGTSDPALGDTLTRAELVTIIVRAFGQEETAKILAGASSFSDVDVAAWYSGYAALAKNIAAQKGITIGYEDGSFKPNQNVTMIEALAFVMKFLGVAPGTGANWAADTIAAAKDAGIISAEDAEAYLADPGAPATRGNAFGLAYAIFSTYQVSAGETVMTTYVDTEAPVLTVNKPADLNTTNPTLTVTGKVEGAVSLWYGSEQITAGADGSFTQEVTLEVGANPITFSAKDLAGNTTTESFTVTRNVGVATAINAELSADSIAAGGEATLTFAVVDANGEKVEANADDITITVGGAVASVDKATGKVVAGTTAGAGTITVSYGSLAPKALNVTVVAGELAKVITSDAAVAPGAAVTLAAQDAYGNTIEGATFSETSADAFIEGNKFIASKAGQYTVTASKDGKSAEGTIGVYGDIAKLVVEAPTEVVDNNATYVTVKVKAADENGNLVGNAEGFIELTTDLVDKDTTSPKVAVLEDGVATFELKSDGTLADLDIIIDAAYDSDDADSVFDEAYGTATVTGVAQVATEISVDAPEYLPTDAYGTGSEQVVTVTVLDQKGEDMLNGAWEFDVTVSGSASLKATSDDKAEALTLATGDKFNIYPVFMGDAGTATLTVSYPGLKTGTATVKAALPLAASKLVLTSDKTSQTVDNGTDKRIEFTVTAVDRYGVPVTSATDVATDNIIGISFDGMADDQFLFFSLAEAAGTPVDGVAQSVTLSGGTATFYVASQLADDFTVKVVDNDEDLSDSNSIAVTYTAGDAKYVAFENSLTNILRSPGKATLTAQLYDVHGNVVKVADQTVTFEDAAASDQYDGMLLAGAKEAYETKTDANGQAKVEVTILDYISTADVKVGGTDLTYGDTISPTTISNVYGKTTVNTVSLIPSTISVDVLDAGDSTGNRVSSIAAGNSVYLKVTVKDNYGRAVEDVISNPDYAFKVTASNSKLILDNVDTDVEWTYDANGVYYSGAINVTKAEALSLTVGLTNLATDVSSSRTIAVKAGPVADAIVVEADADDLVTFDKTVTNELTLQLTDEFFNNVLGSSVTLPVKFTWSSTDTTVQVRDANGIPYTSSKLITISKSRTTTKVYVVSPTAADADLTFEGWIDANNDGVKDLAETSFSVTVNP